MCLATIVLWGFNPILTKLCSDLIGIVPYMMITSVVSSVSTLVINTFIQTDIWDEVQEKMFTTNNPNLVKCWVIALADGVFCLALPMILYNFMLSSSKSVAIVVTTTWYGAPILSTILCYFIFKQHLTYLQIGGIIISIGGIVMMNVEDVIKDVRSMQPQVTSNELASLLVKPPP